MRILNFHMKNSELYEKYRFVFKVIIYMRVLNFPRKNKNIYEKYRFVLRLIIYMRILNFPRKSEDLYEKYRFVFKLIIYMRILNLSQDLYEKYRWALKQRAPPQADFARGRRHRLDSQFQQGKNAKTSAVRGNKKQLVVEDSRKIPRKKERSRLTLAGFVC